MSGNKSPKLTFLLDEGVPVSTGRALEAVGHEVIYFKDSGLAKSSTDPIVCATALLSGAILVAHDKDMRTLARGHGITPAAYRSLSLLQLACRESAGPERVAAAMSLIEHEWIWGEGKERRLHISISDSVIRSFR